jgi:mercuric transport protein
MNKIVATLGVLVVGGGFAVCDLCGGTRTLGAGAQFVGVANAATMPMRLYAAVEGRMGSDVVPAPRTKTVTFNIEGMTCGGCVFGVRKVLTRLPGVSKADVTYEDSRAVVTYDPAAVTVAQMTAAIKTLGYKATVVASTASR